MLRKQWITWDAETIKNTNDGSMGETDGSGIRRAEGGDCIYIMRK